MYCKACRKDKAAVDRGGVCRSCRWVLRQSAIGTAPCRCCGREAAVGAGGLCPTCAVPGGLSMVRRPAGRPDEDSPTRLNGGRWVTLPGRGGVKQWVPA